MQSERPPLPVGYQLGERYRIVALLARARAGATYRAWDQRARSSVAVKEVLDPQALMRRQLRRQAQRLAALSHPQLPAFSDFFFVEGVGGYLVSDFVDGVDLQSLIAQYGPLPEAQAVDWLQQACTPLTYLHGRDQLHLDIKPANLRLRPDGTIILVDSGLPQVGVAPGSSGYAPPEQQAQRDVGDYSDIYALGATLYALLTSQPPADALQREAGLSDLIPAREHNPQVEPYLSLAAARALSLRPDARYESAEQFAKAINRPADLPPIAAPVAEAPPATMQQRRRPLNVRKRRQMETRTIWALLALLLLLLAAGAVGGVISFAPERQSAEQVTASAQSQVAAALTDIAPTPSLTPTPTPSPTPTPQPQIDPLTGAQMVYVPGGVFRMGSENDDNSQPVHRVQLDPYFIDQTEVTNAQYALCVAEDVCTPPQSPNATFHPAYYSEPDYDQYPVIFVDWNQAQTFCEWRDGRLPTEAEWEFAAGYKSEIGQMLRYPWGNVVDEPHANFCDANCITENRNAEFDDGHQDTAPVASYESGRSPFGAYDMAGNVMEWTFDWYDPDYYLESSDLNPLGPLEGTAKSLRGGSWLSTIEGLEVAARGSYLPEVARANLGFRCVRTPQ